MGGRTYSKDCARAEIDGERVRNRDLGIEGVLLCFFSSHGDKVVPEGTREIFLSFFFHHFTTKVD